MARNFVAASEQSLFSSTTPITAAPFTVSTWVRTDTDVVAAANDPNIIQIQDASDAQNYWRLNADSDTEAGEFCFGYADTSQTYEKAVSTQIINTDQWFNVVGIADSGASIRCLVDGANEGTQTGFDLTPSGIDSVSIGQEADSTPGDWWDGQIAEVAIWNVVLVPAELNELAAGASPLLVRPFSLVALWQLIGRTSPEIDIIGGHHAALTNAPTVYQHPPLKYPVPDQIIVAAAATDIAARKAAFAEGRRIFPFSEDFAVGGDGAEWSRGNWVIASG